MEKIKLFEEFILETSDKTLADINQKLSKLLDREWLTTDTIKIMLYYILCANETLENIRKHSVHGKDRYREPIYYIISQDDYTFDMEKGIENFKKLTELNRGVIRHELRDPSTESGNGIIMMDNFKKRALEVVENILDHYKKTKNVDSVDFGTFSKYVLKMIRVYNKTSSDSDASRKNIIETIFKNGFDLMSIEKDIGDYEKKRKEDNLVILSEVGICPGYMDEDNIRHNDFQKSVYGCCVWKEHSDKEPGMICTHLFVKKKEYFIAMGLVGDKTYTPIITFTKDNDPTLANEKILPTLKKFLDRNEEQFGKDIFETIMNDIFRIYGKHGAEVKFNYRELKKKIDNKVSK